MDDKKLTVCFFRSDSGAEPVRDWIKSLDSADKLVIGMDVKTVEFGWPVGMPVCRALGQGLYEVRSNLPSHKIARILFTIENQQMILLHGFIKKTQKTPQQEIEVARKRLRRMKYGK